jgi:hypothetical protein
MGREMNYKISLHKLQEYAADNGWLRLSDKCVFDAPSYNTLVTYQVQDHIYVYTFKDEEFQNVTEVSK